MCERFWSETHEEKRPRNPTYMIYKSVEFIFSELLMVPAAPRGENRTADQQ